MNSRRRWVAYNSQMFYLSISLNSTIQWRYNKNVYQITYSIHSAWTTMTSLYRNSSSRVICIYKIYYNIRVDISPGKNILCVGNQTLPNNKVNKIDTNHDRSVQNDQSDQSNQRNQGDQSDDVVGVTLSTTPTFLSQTFSNHLIQTLFRYRDYKNYFHLKFAKKQWDNLYKAQGLATAMLKALAIAQCNVRVQSANISFSALFYSIYYVML